MATKKTVLVTGCSKGGIGDALAQEFHRKGLRVFATARNLDKVQHLKEMGLDVIRLDVEETESIRDAAAKVGALIEGRLDVLVNNSGSGYHAAMLDCDIAACKKMFDVNVFGLVEVTKIFAPLVVAAHGRIVNVGSIAAKNPVPFQGMYNASKAAVQQISDNMRIEMAPLGVTVIHVVTGGIKTNFHSNAHPCDFPKDSLYDPVRDVIETSVNGGTSAPMLTTLPADYASVVVRNTLSRWPKIQLWYGSQSFISWLGTVFLWHGGSDPILSRMYSLDKISAKLRKQK